MESKNLCKTSILLVSGVLPVLLIGLLNVNHILAIEQQQQESSVKQKISILRGKLIYKKIPPVKSVESYLGQEFLLIVDGKKIVLKPSAKITHEYLKTFDNKQVEIRGIYKPGTRPDVTQVSCPTDLDGKCMIQGEGYEVLSIKVVGKKK
ncbi:MAG TPA: hypothetical protein V6C58_13265 [Allocoleopsis sp.]